MRLSVTSKIAAATGAGIACVAIGVALAGSNHHASQTVVIRQDAATSSQTATASTSTTAASKTSASTTAAAAKQPAAVVQAPVQQAQPAAAPDSTIPAPPASSDVNTLPVATGTVGSDGVLRPPQPPLTISASTSPINGG